MARGASRQPEEERKSAADYYRLKTQAVEDLINADQENSPEVSSEELEKYGAKKKSRVPEWAKVAFIKFWFPGSVFFFMVMGLGLWSPLDQIVILGIVMGMVTDILLNPFLRMRAKPEGSNDRFMMFPRKGYMTFFLNMVYAALICFLVLLAYAGIDRLIGLIAGKAGETFLMAEPVTYGILYLTCDSALIFVKNFVRRCFCGSRVHNR